jgi:chitin disaccharide deacetylase
MLIVNADDLGRAKSATDNAITCFCNGRISSATAMVFMENSEYAARVAQTAGIDVGLHINFSEPLSSSKVSDGLRSDHDKIRNFLTSNKYALLFYHPLLAPKFRSVFDAQHQEFLRLYGKHPSHFDGHEHMHLSSNMLVQRILPVGSKVRRSFSFAPGEKNIANRFYRIAVNSTLAKRHIMVEYFFSLSHFLSIDRLKRVVELAKTTNVELMVHPQRPIEYDFLMSGAFLQLTSQINLSTYSSL